MKRVRKYKITTPYLGILILLGLDEEPGVGQRVFDRLHVDLRERHLGRDVVDDVGHAQFGLVQRVVLLK